MILQQAHHDALAVIPVGKPRLSGKSNRWPGGDPLVGCSSEREHFGANGGSCSRGRLRYDQPRLFDGNIEVDANHSTAAPGRASSGYCNSNMVSSAKCETTVAAPKI